MTDKPAALEFQIELEFGGNVGLWGEGKTGVPGEQPLGARTRTNNKLNPHLTPSPGIEPLSLSFPFGYLLYLIAAESMNCN